MAKRVIEFDYFHSFESEQFAFYRIPKVLFTDDYFKDLSSDAKVLYGLMLDRMSLSMKHRWIDDEDKVYIIFTLEQVTQYMNCKRDKGMKILAELDTKKGIGLIERVKQGFGKPDIIYVKSFIIKEKTSTVKGSGKTKSTGRKNRPIDVGETELTRSESPTYQGRKNRPNEVEKTDSSKSEYPTYQELENRPNEVGKTDLSKSEYPTYQGLENWLSEVGKTDLSKLEKPTYQGLENRLIEVEESDPNYTNNNYTDFYDINHINLSGDKLREKADGIDSMDEIHIYTDIVKMNIEYDFLIQSSSIGDQKYIDEIVEIMVETICIKRDNVLIAGAEYPYQLVKGKLLKVDSSHVQYMLECLHGNVTKIRNIRAYLLTCIYNAPSTINSYYRAEVNHDMHGFKSAEVYQ